MLSQVQFKRDEPEAPREWLCTLSEDGVIRSLSIHANKITDWDEIDTVGKPLYSFLHPDEIPRLNGLYTELLCGDTVTLENIRCLTRTGDYLNWNLSFLPEFQNRKLFEILVIGQPTKSTLPDADKALSQKLAQLHQYNLGENDKSLSSTAFDPIGRIKLMESLLANAPIGFALLDEGLRFICLNQAFSRMTGFSPEQQLGQALPEALPILAKLIKPILSDILTTSNYVVDHEVLLEKNAVVGLTR